MTVQTEQTSSLTEEAKAIIWRIFSVGASPLTRLSSFEVIEPVVRKHMSSHDAEPSIAAIRGWFESYGDRHWLKSDMQEAVAAIILERLGTTCGESEVWAVGSIDAEVATRTVRALWSPEHIDSFVDAALDALEKFCNRENVLDPSRLDRTGSADTGTIRQAIARDGRLAFYQQLHGHGLDLVLRALHPAAGNLLALVIELRPEQFESLVERLDHPVVQARAAHHMVSATLHSDHRAPLRWIAHGSCDGLIALAIVHTLNTVNRLDHDIRLADRADPDRYPPSTELRPDQDDLDTAAAGLLHGLVDRLALLDPPACACWIGELLSNATYVLNRQHGHEIPPHVAQLEKACTELCVRLFLKSWSDNLLPELIAGLRRTRRMSWARHLAEIAWGLRDTDPARAFELATAALDEHERQIAAELKRGHVFLEWHDWDYCEWLKCLGIALAMSCKEIDLPHWVRTRCHALPLSVWDAEENYNEFSSADRVVQHRFLVAFHAIPILKLLGRPADPASVRLLAEKLWAHNAFTERHIHGHADASTTVEYAARDAIEHGAPTDSWLLEQMRDPKCSPRCLWALIDQRQQKNCREGDRTAPDEEFILAEFARIASDCFGDGAEYDLDALRYWGLLWLLLGSVDEAEKTATAIRVFPLKAHDRVYKILALKLLARVARERPLSPALAEFTASLYRQLWSSYTPHEERSDHQLIDETLERSVSRIL